MPDSPTDHADRITVRALPASEWGRMLAFEPFRTSGLPDPEQWRIIVAETPQQIVGFCCVFAAAHWEPWYILPRYRRRPDVVRGLIREGIETMKADGIDVAFAVVSHALPEQQAIVERLGFVETPAKLYTINVADLEGM